MSTTVRNITTEVEYRDHEERVWDIDGYVRYTFEPNDPDLKALLTEGNIIEDAISEVYYEIGSDGIHIPDRAATVTSKVVDGKLVVDVAIDAYECEFDWVYGESDAA